MTEKDQTGQSTRHGTPLPDAESIVDTVREPLLVLTAELPLSVKADEGSELSVDRREKAPRLTPEDSV